LTYTFEPTVTATGTILHVSLIFRTGKEVSDVVEIPTEWAGEKLHAVHNVRALSEDTVISDATSIGSKTIHHLPDQQVVLAYDLVKDWTGRFRHPAEFHGTLMPDYLELTGDNSLLHPKLLGEARVTVHFDWSKAPSAWVLATSFGVGSNPQERCQSYSGTWIAVQHAVFAAGAFRIRYFRIGTQPAVLAVRDQWTFSDEEAIAEIQKAVGAVRDFWRGHNFPYFLVTLKQFDYDSGSGDGSAFTNAFWIYLSRKDSISDQIPVLIHETFHEWDPRRMGPPSSPEDWKAIEWFREGFVSYYGYVLALRANLIQLPAYLDNLNRDLRVFPGSQSAYVRGRIIALWLDQQIRKDSGGKRSLDTVMHDMVNGAVKPLTERRILQTAGRYLQSPLRTELARIIQPDSDISLSESGLGPCVRGSVDDVPTFDLGFDLGASTTTGRITGVEADGPAFQAGLRNGQQLSGRLSVYNNQPEKGAIVTIKTGDGSKAIEYYPRGKPIAVMQYHLDQETYATNPGRCQNK
jgi:predicted metalloprotease with PDZ domain